jgi:hypothetical protein
LHCSGPALQVAASARSLGVSSLLSLGAISALASLLTSPTAPPPVIAKSSAQDASTQLTKKNHASQTLGAADCRGVGTGIVPFACAEPAWHEQTLGDTTRSGASASSRGGNAEGEHGASWGVCIGAAKSGS